jgi:hypothetical protein
MLANFDKWVVVDGASGSGGTTGQNCKSMSSKYHDKNGGSVDGTREFLTYIRDEKNIHVVCIDRKWESKEEQVNAAVKYASGFVGAKRLRCENCFLWEVDADEQWDLDSIQKSEEYLLNSSAKTGEFLCNYYVGENLIAKGEWGEGNLLPYRRLWKWSGELFETHEPPLLQGGNGKTVMIPYRFNHYAYYFEEDVKFKNDWYKGHENIYQRWKELKNIKEFPVPISKLIGNGMWGKTNTFIYKEK